MGDSDPDLGEVTEAAPPISDGNEGKWSRGGGFIWIGFDRSHESISKPRKLRS